MCKRRINWASTRSATQDKIGVFVSLVSTKVPFKGTGKEYIGDDIPEVQAAVKRAIEKCCVQRVLPPAVPSTPLIYTPIPLPLLAAQGEAREAKAAKDEHERRKNLTKYIPDVSRSLFSMLEIISDPTGVGAVSAPPPPTPRATPPPAAQRPSHLDALVDDVRAGGSRGR